MIYFPVKYVLLLRTKNNISRDFCIIRRFKALGYSSFLFFISKGERIRCTECVQDMNYLGKMIILISIFFYRLNVWFVLSDIVVLLLFLKYLSLRQNLRVGEKTVNEEVLPAYFLNINIKYAFSSMWKEEVFYAQHYFENSHEERPVKMR